MSMKFMQTKYANGKNILAIKDHHVAIGFLHNQKTDTDSGLAIKENGRWVVKAGSIYPSNDENAIGVVLQDYDVTDGDKNIAVVVHGFIKLSNMETVPTDEAKLSLNQIKFL